MYTISLRWQAHEAELKLSPTDQGFARYTFGTTRLI